ncbi:hypothetical protein AAZX31_13G086900 [Glycine max]
MPLDLNEDQNHEFFSPIHHPSSSFSSLSSSYPILFNPPNQDQEARSYDWETTKHLPSHEEEAEKIIPTSGSWGHSVEESEHKVTVWRKEERNENLAEDGSVKWMPSKMRIMRKMLVSNQTDAYTSDNNTTHKFDDHKQQLSSPLGIDDNSSNNYSDKSNNSIVRVCSDCHTTKTPLWRSGPRGPKSLCNACGIRQRKARRAMAAAAAAALGDGAVIVEAEKSVKGKKLQKKKEKKTRIEGAAQMKMKRKLGVGAKASQSRNKFGFEDLTLRLRKNLAMHQVFPQDEKEAAILLMALSYGLVH